MANIFFRKLFSLVNIASLVFQLVAPLVTLAPLPAYASSLESKLSWDSSKNSFHFSVNSNETVDYLLAYRTNEKTEAITGSGKADSGNFERDLYAGTCSSGVCLPHQVLRGILKTQVKTSNWTYTRLFTINSGNLDVVKSGTDKDLNLSDEEVAWLENPTSENLGKITLVAADSLPSPPADSTPSATVSTPSAETPPPPSASASSQATVAGTQTENTEHGSLSAAILKNTAAPSLDLSSPVSAGSATVTTNKPDYSPTDTVVISGSGFKPDHKYTLEITSSDPPPVDFKTDITTKPDGTFVYAYQLDGNYRPNYTIYVKQGDHIVATTTFTDSQPAASLEQCHNKNGSSYADCKDPSSPLNTWGSGSAGSGNAKLFEGNSQNYRLILTDMPVGTAQTITIGQQFTKGGKMAYDFPTGPGNLGTATTPIGLAGIFPCDNNSGGLLVTPCDHLVPSSMPAGNKLTITPIPASTIPDATVDGETRAAQATYYATSESTPPTRSPNYMYVYGATPGSFGGYSFVGNAADVASGDSELDWSFSVTPTSSTVVIAWGAHISKNGDYGTKGTAVSISGSPYHTSLVETTFTSGRRSQDMQMSAGAIIPFSTITIHKITSPGGGTGFGFTTTGGLTPATFSLNDAGAQSYAETVPGSYTVVENDPSSSGYALTGLTCGTVTGTGTSATPNLGTRTVSITIGAAGGGNVDCTYTNTIQNGTLTVNKVLVPSNDSGLFNLQIDGSTAGTGANVGNGGTTGAVSVSVGSHIVGETAGTSTDLANYTSVISGNCDAQGNVSVPAGTNKTCTITNTRKPRLTVIKVVTNDNGGTKQVSDFPLFVDGNSVTSGATNTFSIGSHVVSETGDTNYTASFSGNCDSNGNVTLAAGDNKTCTITNNDKAPSLHLRKTVTNDNGGAAVATAWTLTATGTGGSPTNLSGSTPVDSGSNFKADTYALAESGGPSGYTAGTWNCVGGTMGDASHVTIALGESATCTINNNDVAPTLKLVKTVTNNDGGSAVAGNWNLTATGTGGFTDTGDSTTFHPVNANVQYTLSESGPSGYDPSSWSCDGGTQSTNHITLSVGQDVTCTITNNDQAAHLIVIKHIVNDNGGTALASDFTMTINGVSASGGNSFAGAESPGTNKTLTSVGPYSVSESGPSGYTASYSSDCTGAIALGQTKTCTVTNDDNAPSLTLVKEVVNDDGGQSVASAWTLTASGPTGFSGPGPSVSNGASFDAGTYNLSESGPANYSASSWTCVGGNQTDGDTVVIGLGDQVTCTITNNDNAPSLKLVKSVTNNNGGTATPGNWTLTATGDGGFSDTGDSTTFHQIKANTNYVLSESIVPGYTAGSWSCDGGNLNGDTLTLGLGARVTCTITNDDQPAHLIVTKHVVTDNGGTATASNFTMTITGVTATGGNSFPGSESGTDKIVTPGSYVVSESGPGGYAASYTTGCVGTIALGETKYCTWTNDDIAPQLTVVKHVVNDNGGEAVAGNFTMSVSGTNVSNPSFAGSETGTTVTLDAGSYSVSESGLTGYAASYSANCSGTIDLAATKTCTVTNDDEAPSLTLIKEVLNDDGGTTTASQWTLSASGPTSFSGSGPTVNNGTSFDAGTYALSESGGPSGYAASEWVCDGGDQDGDSVTVGLGEQVTCTITNDDIAPTLTVNKVLSPSNDPGRFDLQIDDTTYASDVTNGGTTGAVALSANTEYTVGESAGTGTNLSDYRSEISGDCDTDGLITLLPGEAKTCTITNTRKTGNVTFQKIVSGGTAVASDWGFTVEGVTGTFHDSDTTNLNTGTYLATESSKMSGYTPTSASGICGNLNGSTATLTVTENGGTCTFTNTRDTGTVVIHKQTDADGNGSYETGDAGSNTLGFRWGLGSGDTNRLMGSNETITTGDPHSVTENSIAGFAFTGWYETGSEDFSCKNPESTTLPVSFTVTKGGTRSFTLCNQFQNPILTISKTNNAGGDKAPGDNVTFTLTVTATQSAAFKVKVTDLPAGGFTYHSGSWTATRNGVPFSLPEPVYHSPGVWQIGDMAKDDVVVLTYRADIEGSIRPGLYKDLAWAAGCKTDTDCSVSDSNAVLSSAVNPGFVANNFVGTQVNVVREELTSTSLEGQVLGASTSLPSTGGKTIWVILATLLVLSGGALMLIGFKKKMFVVVLALFAGLTFLAQKPVLAFDSLSVRIEQPKSPTKDNSFDINFVALDILNRSVTVQCFKKGPSDGSFSQFGSNINLASGGNSGYCHVDSGIVNSNNSTYQFYVKATAGGDTATSTTDSVDYNTSGPGTPSNYSKDRLSSCQYKINFKTADDGGKTVKVEIYRSTLTSFTLDSGTRVGSVSIGSNTTGSFTDTVPDCGATYYYEIRAFDSAGNGSGVVGDDVNVTTPTTTTSGTTGGGAIPVSGANIPAGPSVLGGQKAATGEGGILGEATPSPEERGLPGPATGGLLGNNPVAVILLVLLGILIAAYALYRRRQNQS